MPIKVLLADDVQIVRRAIRSVLKEEPRIEIVGEASELSQTLRMAEALKPQVIVMDLHMPNTASIAPSEAKSRLAKTRLLAISVFDDEETKAMADSFGAVTLLDKMKLGTELIPTIIRLSLRSKTVAASGESQAAASSVSMF
jgi:two-component system response regulator DevR